MEHDKHFDEIPGAPRIHNRQIVDYVHTKTVTLQKGMHLADFDFPVWGQMPNGNAFRILELAALISVEERRDEDYTLDGSSWAPFVSNTATVDLAIGDRSYIRAVPLALMLVPPIRRRSHRAMSFYRRSKPYGGISLLYPPTVEPTQQWFIRVQWRHALTWTGPVELSLSIVNRGIQCRPNR